MPVRGKGNPDQQAICATDLGCCIHHRGFGIVGNGHRKRSLKHCLHQVQTLVIGNKNTNPKWVDMRLTSFTDVDLRALMRVASLPDRALSTAELADDFVLLRHQLTKIMAAMAQAGIVTARRGAGGCAMVS